MDAQAADAARRTGHRVEVLDARSETSQTWANPDGTRSTSLSAVPVRFRVAGGAWRDIDLTAVAAASGIAAVSAQRPTVLPVDASGAIGVPSDAGAVLISHPGAAGAAVLAGSSVTYPHAVQGRDLVEQLLVHGVEETAQLASVTDGGSYDTVFTVPTGVTAVNFAGGVAFTDAAGKTVGSFGGGLASDAAHAEAPVTATVAARPAGTCRFMSGSGRAG